MIDSMVALLGSEQKADDEKKAYCEDKLDKAEDEKKILDQKSADMEKAMAEAKEAIATLEDELDTLASDIKKLDKEVEEATEMRQAEHEEFVSTTAADNAAKELIGMAKNRLAKFYNPKLYKAAPKRQLTEDESITLNFGGSLAPTAAPGGIAGTGVTAFRQEQPPVLVQVAVHRASAKRADPGPPPAAPGPFQKKGEESQGVMTMLDMMVADLDKEIQTMTVDEKNAQKEYEEFIAFSKEKRATSVSAITDKEGAKADAEASLEKLSVEHKDTMMETMAKDEEIKDLHLECDWLLSNFDTRKEARAGEVESLKKAKDVLSGADYSLVQTDRRAARLHR